MISLLTEAEIKKNLRKDPDWEPALDASDEDWDLFESVRDEMDLDMDLDTDSDDEDSKKKKKPDTWSDDDVFSDDNPGWDSYSDDY
ncbi:MAG: hypothetical protein ACOZAO_04640 [Patescibacteria group bacterium]